MTSPLTRPPRGQQRDKPYREALRMELAAAGGDLMLLREIAKAHLALAKSGDMHAIKEMADRLDGKPAQEQHIRIEDKRDASDWTRDELVTFLNDARDGGGGTVAPDRRNGGPDSLH